MNKIIMKKDICLYVLCSIIVLCNLSYAEIMGGYL